MAINLVISQVVGQAFVVKPDGELVQAAPNTVLQTGDVLSVPNGKNAWLVTEEGEQLDVLDEALLVGEEDFDNLDLPSDVLDVIAAIEEGDDPTQKEGTETAAGEEAAGSALTAASIIEYIGSTGGISNITAFDSTGLFGSNKLTSGQTETLFSSRYLPIQQKPGSDDEGAGGNTNAPPTFGNFTISSQEDGDIILSREDILGAIRGGNAANIQVTDIRPSVEGATITKNSDGSFTLTPPPNFSGTINFTIDITDGQYKTSGTVGVTVAEVEDTPEISITPVELTEDENVAEGSVVASIDATDGDGDALTIEITNDPDGYFKVENGNVVLTEAGAAAIDDDTLNLDEISVTVSVSDGKTTVEETVTLPISRTDDDAKVEGDTTATVTDGNGTVPPSATGTLTVVDPDSNNETALENGTYKGEYGSLEVNNGVWVYTADKEALAPLGEGEQATDIVTITASDGSTHQIVLNIEGTNDPALVSGDISATVSGEGGNLQASGTLTSNDVDGENNTFIAETITTLRGELTINEDGSWSYVSTDPTGAIEALGEGDTLTEYVTVKAADGTEQQIVITFQGVNDDAVFSAISTGEITESDGAMSAQGTININDPDAGESFMQAGTFDGTWGSVTIDAAGNWTYTTHDSSDSAIKSLADGEKMTDTITVYSVDGTETQITITINGTNDEAVIGGDITATVVDNSGTMTATGTLTSADVDGTDNKFVAETISTLRGEITIDEDGNWTYTTTDPTGAIERLPEGETLTEVVIVRSEDGTEQQIVLTLVGTNNAPEFSAISSRDVYEANDVISVSGTINVVDSDLGESFMEAGTYVGDLGAVTIDRAGNWTYTTDPGQNAALDSLKEGEQRIETITVRSEDGTETDIKVTIIGTNDPALIAGDIVGTVVEADGTMSTSGQLTATDVDGNDNTFTPQTLEGRWGELTIDANGNWTYSSDDDKGAINRLGLGEQLTDTLTVQSEDGTEQTITITITGTNDAAVFGGMNSVSIDETDSQLTTSGRLTVSDADYGESFFEAGTFNGTYGEVSIDEAGNWTYTSDPAYNATFDALEEGEQLVDTITVRSQDGTETQILVTVVGTNDPAEIAGDIVGTLVESDGTMSTSGQLTSTDVDGNDNAFTPQTIEGRWGEITIDANGNWTYSSTDEKGAINRLGEGDQLTDTISVRAEDGTVQTITITIDGTNDTAVFGGMTNVTVTETDSAITTNGRATVSDADYGESFFQAGTFTGTYGEINIDKAGNWTYTSSPEHTASFDALDAGDVLPESITVYALDGTPLTIEINIQGTDDLPVVSGQTGGALTDTTTGEAQFVTGSLSISDVDADDSPTFEDTRIEGEFGVLEMVDGEWTYTLDKDAASRLNSGETDTDIITVTASDGTEQKIVITVTGTDDEPVLTGNTVGSISDNGSPTTSGFISVIDPDSDNSPTLPDAEVDGQYGSLTLIDGEWTYTLNPDSVAALPDGETTIDVVTLEASDGSKHEITITITGTDQEPVLTGNTTGVITEGSAALTATGSVSLVDVDTGENPTLPNGTTDGQYGSLTLVDGAWTYTLDPDLAQYLDEGESTTDTITITASDGSVHDIVITITGSEDSAMLEGDISGSVSDDSASLTASGSLSVSDPDTSDNPTLPDTNQQGQYGSFTMVDGNWTYTLDPELAAVLDEGVTVTDTIIITDSMGGTHELAINVTGTDNAAELTGDTSANLVEGTDLTATGSVSVIDADSGDNPVIANTDVEGQYGSFSLVDGEWTYTLDPSVAQGLNAGQTATDTITLVDSENNEHQIVITVEGTADAAVVSGEFTGSVSTETGPVVEITNLFVFGDDADGEPANFSLDSQPDSLSFSSVGFSANITDSDGRLNNDGSQYIELNGQSYPVSANATVQYSDAYGNVFTMAVLTVSATETGEYFGGTSQPTTLLVQIDGPDIVPGTDLALVEGSYQEVSNINYLDVSDAITASGQISISDADTNDTPEFANTTLEGNYGTLELVDGNWTYTLDPSKSEVLGANEVATETFTLTASDDTQQQIKIEVTGTDDAAIVTGNITGSVTDQDTSTSGSINITDPDSGQSATIDNVTIEGEYGTFELIDGNWTYIVDPDKAKPLPEGEEATDTFTLTASDGSTHEIVVTVTGTDDAAVVTGDTTGQVTDQDTSTSGSITVTDPDSGETATIDNVTIQGEYGTFELVDGEWTYTVDPDKAKPLPEGEEATDTFTLTAIDGSTHEIVVTVTGTDDAAVVTGDTTATISDVDTSATGSITVTDPDSGETATIGNTTIEGNYGTFELVDGNWTYTVDPDKAQSLAEGQEANETFTLTASDNSMHEIVVTVTGTNQSAVVTGDTTATISDVDASATGSITVTDPDSGETATIGNTTIEGNYGTFELVDGNWTYTVDPDKAQSLPEGEEANETFTLTASDNSTHEIVVTVTGTNQSAVVTGDTTATISDVDASATGSITVTDPDSGETATIGNTTIEGNYGTFELVDGNWTYTVDPDKAQSLPEGEEANETFTLTASDNSTHEIVVTVTGTNQSAVVTGDTTAAISDVDTSATGSITVTDPDSGETATIGNTTIDGNYGTFELVDGNWTYTVDPDKAQSLPEGQEANETFTLTASDNSTHEIVVTVTGTNQSAVVTGDTTAAISDVDTSATGSITVTDPDSGETATIGNTTIEGNYGTFELVDGNWTYTVDPDKAQSLPEGEEANETFTLTASDNSTHEIVVTVTGTNQSAVVTGDTTAAINDVDTSATGSITVTDPDSGETASIGNTTIEGNYGTFELVDGNWTYTVDPDKAQALPDGEEATETFTLTASDNSTHEIVVTVTGTNQSAVVTGDTTAAISDVDTSATGSITVTDPDSGETATIGNTTIEGNYGTFELVDGNWTYTVDPDKAQALPEGEEATETFTLTASDNSTHEIVVTVEGTNQSAVVTGDTTATISDVDASATGSITVTDPDSGETATIGNTTIEGNYGTFELVDGNWTYTVDPDKAQSLPEGEEANETFTLTASDNSTHEIVVTVEGTNQSAVVTGDTTASITDVDTSATGSITVTDPDSGETATIGNTTIEGNYGTFELVDGNWTYTVDPDKAQALPEGEEANETFTLTASDNSVHEIVVTVTGTNQSAVVTGNTTASITDVDTSATGSITVTDPDSGETASIDNTTIEGNYGTFELVDGNWTYTVDPDKAQTLPEGQEATETFTLTASDNSQHEITVTVEGTDQAAVVTGDTTTSLSDTDTSVSGSITVTDPDSGETASISNTDIDGEYGTFSLVDGEWTYTVDPDKAEAISLGDTETETFTLTASDGSTHQITVDVVGTDQAAVVTGTTTGTISTADLSSAIVGNAFIMDENFSIESGEFHTSNLPPSINFSSGGVSVEFTDNDARLDGDNTHNEYSNDSSQTIELNGVTYPANLDYTLQYTDAQGNVYTMAIVDVDTNADGNNYNAIPDNGKVLIQLDGPEITPDTTLTLVPGSYNNIDGLDYDDIAAPVTVSGTIEISDVDSNDSPSFANTTVEGQYGSLTLEDGEWTYTVDRDKVESLGSDDNVQDVITLTASDGTTQNITINVSGTDDGSIIAGDVTGSITEDVGAQSVSGTITITDPDSGQTPTIPDATLDGAYGTLELVGGEWTYTVNTDAVQSLAQDQVVTDNITVTASDGNQQVISITLTGTNDAAVVTGDTTGNVTDADASTSGTITVTDPDSGETATIGNTTIEGNYGTFELVDGNWTYTVDPDKAQPLTDGETAQDTFTLTASDGSTHDVTVTVTGTDNAGVVTGTTSGSVDAAGFTLNVEESGNLTAGQVTQGDSNGGWNTTTTSIDGVPYVISTSFGYDGTTIISRVENDGSLTETDRITYDSSTGVVTSSVSGDITSAVENAGFSVGGLGNGLTQSNVSNIDGQPTLFLTSQNSGSISAWEISGNGQLTVNGGLTFGNSQTGIVRENVTFETDDGETLIFATRPQGDTVDVLSYNPETGEIAETGNSYPSGDLVSGIDIVTIDGNTFVTSSGTDVVSLYAVDSATGNLTLVDSEPVTSGSGNSVNFYQTPDGSTYAISSSSSADVTTVFEVAADGTLTQTDVIENAGAYMSTAGYVDGEPVFVAPNPDGGVDLYTINSEGSLVHQGNVAAIENDNTPPVIVQTADGSYYLVDADGNTATVKLEIGESLITTSGSLDVVDVDGGDTTVFENTTVEGTYGTLELVDGNWTYTLDEAKSESLGEGDTAQDVITLTATDGTQQDITITVTGTDDLAELTGDVTATVTDADASVSGSITVVDPDTGDNTTIANTTMQGEYGTFQLVDGDWTYTVDPAKAEPLPEGQSVEDTFTLTASDGSTHDVTVTVTGTDNAGVVTGTTSGSVDAAGFTLNVEESGNLTAGEVTQGDNNSGWNTTTTTIDGVPYVISTSFGYSGTTIISRVEDDGSLTETDRIVYDNNTGTVTSSSGGDITAVIQEAGISVGALGNGLTQSNVSQVDGEPTLFLTSQNSGSISAWQISDSGELSLNGGLTFGNSQTGIVRENVTFETDDGETLIFATRPQGDTVDVLSYNPETGEIAETGNSYPSGDLVSGIDIVTIDGNTFVTSSGTDVVSLYAVDSATGNLTLVDSEPVTSGSGNSVNFYQTPDGSTYAISSSSSADVTTVFEVAADGTLTQTDVIENAGAYMSTAGYVDGEPVFVAPNPDGGVDLYTINSEGSLVHQGNVTSIENDNTPPVIVQTTDGSYYLVDADGNTATVKLEIGESLITTSGSLDVVDVDGGDTTVFENTTVEGTYGTLELVDGNWTYTLDETKSQSLGEDQTAQDVITLTATDGTQQDITITVTGTDDLAEVTGDLSAQISEDSQSQTVSGTLSITDVDTNDTPSFANTTVAGQFGSLSLVDGEWTYTLSDAAQSLSEGQQVEDVITLTATDGTTQDIVITVTGADDASFISGTTSGSVTEGDAGDVITTSGKLSVSDIDNDNVTIPDSNQSGTYGSLSLVDGEWTYTLDNSKVDSLNEGQNVTDTFTVEASDGSTQEIVVNITGSDDAAVLSGDTTGTISSTSSTTQNVTINRGSDGTWDVGEGDNLYLNMSNITTSAAYSNSVGYYVMDAGGNVIRSAIIFDNAHSVNNSSININTSGGEKVGLFLIPDGDSKGFNVGSVSLSFGSGGVTAYQGGASGTTFVSESSKNGSDFDYEINSGTYSGWEDLVGGGDRDFNDVAFYVTATQQQGQPISASGSIGVSDVDSGDTPTLPNTTVQGEFGTLVLTNGNWTYTFDESKAQQIDEETLETIVITDSEGGQHEIVIAIQGTDDAPIVTGVFSGAVTEGDYGDKVTVSGNIAISDPDADDTPEFLNTTIQGDYGTLTLTDGVWTYELDDVKAEVLSSSDYVTDTITLTATDGTVQNINVSITGTNDDPFVVGTNTAAIVAPDSVTSEFVDIGNAFVLNEGYTFSGGDMQYYGNEPTFQFNDSGSTIRFYDNDTTVDGDNYSNEYVQDSSQKVEINGVQYTATYDYQLDYQDSAGNIYSFAVFDVDLDGDGSFKYDSNEQGRVIVQIDGPQITPGLTMDYLRDTPNQPRSMSYSDFTDFSGATLEATGVLSIVDLDANDSQPEFADTTVNGQYGSLVLTDGAWTYTLDPHSTPALGEHDTVTEVISLTATNGMQTQVNVTIGGSESAVNNASLNGVSDTLDDVIALDEVTFSGSDGNDRIAGSSEVDVLLGNSGDDVIYGNAGNDIIDGGLGDDLIFGGQGNDLLAGGAGSDTYAFLRGDQGTVSEPAVDHIADFDTQQDAINLSDLLNNETADSLGEYLSFSDDGEGHAMLNISSQGDGNIDQQVVFDNMSMEDMADAYSVDITGMTSEQISSSVIDAMVMQSKMIID